MDYEFTSELADLVLQKHAVLETAARYQVKSNPNTMPSISEDLARTTARRGNLRKNVFIGGLDGAFAGGFLGLLSELQQNPKKKSKYIKPVVGAILGGLLGAGVGMEQGLRDLKKTLVTLKKDPESIINAYQAIGAPEEVVLEIERELTPQNWLDSSQNALNRLEESGPKYRDHLIDD